MTRIGIQAALLSALAILPACTNDAPPPGAVTAAAAFPAIGTSWVLHVTDTPPHPSGNQRYAAVSSTYRDAPVYGIRYGNNVDIYNPQTFNYMAKLSNGTEMSTNSPDSGEYSWPLWVGKSWTATVNTEFPNGGSPPSVNVFYRKVTAYEDFTVPAGTFKAFRIESWPGQGVDPGYHFILWYAPSVPYIVKSAFSLSNRALAGERTITTEMVSPPQP